MIGNHHANILYHHHGSFGRIFCDPGLVDGYRRYPFSFHVCQNKGYPFSNPLLSFNYSHGINSYFFGYDIALTPLLVAYPVEIWPYSLRAKGLSVTFLTTLAAVFFNTFVNPIALDAIQWKYYFVFIVVLVAMLATVWFYYPETRGHTLGNMAWIFDRDSAATTVTMAEDAIKMSNMTHLEKVESVDVPKAR